MSYSKQTVPPEINVPNRRAPLVVGRDPGGQEVSDGRPFVGRSGRLLFGGYDSFLGRETEGSIAQAGWMREDCNIANRVPVKPWNNEFYRHEWGDIKQGKKDLLALIADLDPSIIIACGAQAAYDLVPGWATLTDKKPGDYSGGRSIKSAKGILDRRGFAWYDHNLPTDAPVIVTLHPASCLYQAMPNRLLLDVDLARAGHIERGELPRQDWPDYTRITTSGDLAPVWDADLVAYDIEVTWGGDKFLCIALYTDTGHAFLAYEDGLGALEEWLASDRPKLAHNGQFDRYYLEAKCGLEVNGRHEDTIVAHWSCYPELAGKKDTGREDQRKKSSGEMTRKGLNFLASFHLNVPWWKTYTSDRHMMGRLCVNDVVATMECWKIIEPELDAMNVRQQYENQMAKIPALIAIQKRGFRIDEEMRLDRLESLDARQRAKEKEATDAAETFLKTHNITHGEDGEEYSWYHDARCECCFGGSFKSQHCDVCAGISGSGSGGAILKKDLVLWCWRNTDLCKSDCDSHTKDELMEMLPPCAECDGRGTLPEWDFNIMSPKQMPELLWDHLDVPLYTCNNSPNAQEDTLKKVLEWAKEQRSDAE